MERLDGRRNEVGGRKYEIAELRVKPREIARLQLLGFQNKVIAALVGLTPEQVSNIVNSEVYKNHLEELAGARDDEFVRVQKRIQSLSVLAMQRIEEAVVDPLADSHPGGLTAQERLTAAFKVIDRAGHSPVQKSVNVNAKVEAEIQASKERSLELARSMGLVSDYQAPEEINIEDVEEGEDA